MSSIEKIEDLVAWKKARELTRIVYEITKNGAFSKDFALRDQARRSAISVASNIAEGFGRGGSREFLQFLSMSKGSLYELKTQLYIASDLKYITNNDLKDLNELINEASKIITGLMNYLRSTEIKGSKFKE